MTLPTAERLTEGTTPTTRRHTLPRLPALDGLRAVALGAVLLFHADYVWAKGGHLGVTAFFTLSGFLITALLLLERDATGRIDLVAFWGRRARRLVPAALVCLALVVVYVAASPEVSFDGLLGDAAASVTWLANWRFVAEGEAYADLFSTPSPFQHFWSLAIEEQFYLALPVLAAVVLGVRSRSGRTRPARRLPLAIICLGVIAASTAAVGILHHPDEPALRAYYGTDARIAEPLVGVVLALILVGPAGLRRFSVAGRRVADTLGVAALVGLALVATTLSIWDTRLYEGGFLLAAVLTAFVVMAATQRGGIVDRMLSAPILAGIGRISYGGYLFHWPVYLWITEYRTGLEGSSLLALRLGVTLTLASISYLFVELPIRERRLPVQVGALAWPTATVGLLAALVLAMAMPVPSSGPASVSSGLSGGGSRSPRAEEENSERKATEAEDEGRSQRAAAASTADASEPRAPQEEATPGTATETEEAEPVATTAPPPVEPRARVAVVGDSVGENLGVGFEMWAEETGEVEALNLAIRSCPVGLGGTRRFPNGHVWNIKPTCSWWQDEASETFAELRAFDPDVVVVQDSIAELPDRKQDEWPTYSQPGRPLYDTWLIDEYENFIETMNAEGAAVVVTNAVCAEFDRHHLWRSVEDAEERVAALNRQVYPVLAGRSEIADLNAEVCPDGEFTNSLEGYDDARPDGFHFRDEVAEALVRRWLGPIAISASEM